jgi:NADPH-dependent 2,4-dienoyl-CoA reductase/sulfur reductase-like enzyme
MYIASNPKKLGTVVLKSGEKLPADIVILGAGVSPKTDFLKGSGVNLDRDGGITVESSMKVPGVDDVYAVGDISRYKYHVTDEMVRIEHWNVAQNQGRVAALNIIAQASGEEGTHVKDFTQVSVFSKITFKVENFLICIHLDPLFLVCFFVLVLLLFLKNLP